VLGGRAVWSGDTVRRDAQGLLYFVGRSDETIKTMGTRVSPTEVEEVAHASGAVSACAAFGEANERAGQRILLIASPRGEDAASRLSAHFRTAAPGYMAPARVVWLDSLPLSANGKIDRAALRAAHAG
jgi:acyl-coenzyme A synthetase/AMP-(fatty) acid ligase